MNNHLTKLLLMGTVAASALLAACQETVDARWTTPEDSVYRWSQLEKTAPLELYGQLPNISSDEIIRFVPNATPGELSQGEPTTTNASDLSKRLVLSIGEHKSPAGNAYCEDRVHGPSMDSSTRSTDLTLALCDGGRLVAWSSTPIDLQEKSPTYIAHKVKRLKSLALIGISQSPAQYSPIDGPVD